MLIGIIDSGIGGLEIVKRLSINNKYYWASPVAQW